jgi:hypothetical protein
MTLLQRRRLEAGVFKLVFDVLAERWGRELALEVIGQAVEKDARTAGESFAARAPDGPGLEHFATILERLAQGGALELDQVELEPGRFSYCVTRCRYVEQYTEMGIDRELAYTLSCRRDAAFARGYHPDLLMERPATLARDQDECRFLYTWRRPAQP